MFAAFVVSTLLFWVCVVVLTVGMVSPRLVLRGERRTRGRVGAIYGSLAGGLMIASMIIGVGAAVNDPGFQEAAADPRSGSTRRSRCCLQAQSRLSACERLA